MAKISPRERLRKWRAGRSYTEVGVLLGIDRGHAHGLEHGGRYPSAELARRLEAVGAGAAAEWLALQLERPAPVRVVRMAKR